MTAEIFWAIIGTLVTIIIALVGGIMAVRNEIGKRSEQRWQRAISYAEVLSSADAPPLVKQVAQMALYDVGIEIRDAETRADHPSLRRLDPLVDAFDPPPSEEQKRQLKEAIETLPTGEVVDAEMDPDIKTAAEFLRARLMGLEAAFNAARRSGRPEDDIRLRIAFVLVFMASGFLVLAVAATRAALFA
jgi:hypothetical protein